MTVSLSNHLAADSAAQALRRDVYDGLTQTPKTLPPKWFYDSVGSDLFDQITRLPEYYPTRTEAEILRDRSAEIAVASGADTLVELGSGTSEKTRLLLSALRDTGSLRRFIPFDVDAGVLQAASSAILDEYPGIEIDAVCGDFEEHLGKIPRVGRRLVVFLGSTIGNLTPGPRAEFLSALSDTLQPGDALLLGTDLVKDTGRLVRAYDDSAGVTARFNRNVLAVVNRELDAEFDLESFEHVARWNADEERIEMWLRARSAQQVRIAALNLTIEFAAGEEMLTEVSCKFRPEGVADVLTAAGLRRTHWWYDRAVDFGLSLSNKCPNSRTGGGQPGRRWQVCTWTAARARGRVRRSSTPPPSTRGTRPKWAAMSPLRPPPLPLTPGAPRSQR